MSLHLVSGCVALQTVLRDFDVIQTFELRNNLELLLHFKLETQSPFIVLKPQPLACTRNSSDLRKDDSQYLFLQPQQRMVVRCGEVVMFWMVYPAGNGHVHT